MAGLVNPSCFIIHPNSSKIKIPATSKNSGHFDFTKYFSTNSKKYLWLRKFKCKWRNTLAPFGRSSGFINEICLQMFKFTYAICKYISYMFYFCNYSLPGNMDGLFWDIFNVINQIMYDFLTKLPSEIYPLLKALDFGPNYIFMITWLDNLTLFLRSFTMAY